MEKKIQSDIFGDFYQGKLKNVHETKTGIMLTIDMSEFKEHYYSSLFYCELVNCRQFQMIFNGERMDVKDVHLHDIELRESEFEYDNWIVHCCRDEETLGEMFIEAETINVYDESRQAVDLLDLAIYAGLCSAGSGIDFMIGKTKREAYASDDSVKFDETVFDYLAKHEYEQYRERYIQKRPPEAFDLLFALDPYGTKTFSKPEIYELLTVCDGIVAKYHTDQLNDRKVRYFAGRLKELCVKAEAENLMMVAVGD